LDHCVVSHEFSRCVAIQHYGKHAHSKDALSAVAALSPLIFTISRRIIAEIAVDRRDFSHSTLLTQHGNRDQSWRLLRFGVVDKRLASYVQELVAVAKVMIDRTDQIPVFAAMPCGPFPAFRTLNHVARLHLNNVVDTLIRTLGGH
jgi:hypothetical protein